MTQAPTPAEIMDLTSHVEIAQEALNAALAAQAKAQAEQAEAQAEAEAAKKAAEEAAEAAAKAAANRVITDYQRRVLVMYRDGTGPEHVAGTDPAPLHKGRAAWLKQGFPALAAKGLIEPAGDGWTITDEGREAIEKSVDGRAPPNNPEATN